MPLGQLDVLVVVVTHNSADHIDGLLESIPAAAEGLAIEIVVVDNGSCDDTRARVRDWRGVRLIEAANNGYAAGLNLGVSRSSDCAAVLLVNPDAALAPRSIALLYSELWKPRVGITVPLVVDESGERVPSLRREPTIRRTLGLNWTGLAVFSEWVTDDVAYEAPGDWDWAVGAIMLFRRSLWSELGGWDESYFLYSEETDFCLRARDAAWRTRFVPSAEAMHVGGGSGRTELTHAMQAVNGVRLYARRHHPIAAMFFWAAVSLREASWWVRGQRTSRAALRALLRPAHRPPQLGLGKKLLPR